MNFNDLKYEGSKKYIINALKGIGIGEFDKEAGKYKLDMSLKGIESFLNEATTDGKLIYRKIYRAIYEHSHRDDLWSQNFVASLAYDRAALKGVIHSANSANSTQLDEKSGEFLKQITTPSKYNNFKNHNAVTIVVDGLISGLRDQKLKEEEKAEVIQFFEGIYNYNGFNQWLENRQNTPEFQQLGYNPNISWHKQEKCYRVIYNKYSKEQFEKEVWDSAIKLFGYKNAKKFLTKKIDKEDRKHLRYAGVLKKSEDFCIDDGRDPENELTMKDVLLTLSKESSHMEVLTYLKSRSFEQEEDLRNKSNPLVLPDKKYKNKDKLALELSQCKIGNLLGRNGCKKIEQQTEKDVKVIIDKKKPAKEGKTMWKGYKDVYYRIEYIMRDVFKSIQAIGMANKFAAKYLVKENAGQKISVKPVSWEDSVSFNISDGLAQKSEEQSNTAKEEFYYKTKSRLLADNMELKKISLIEPDNETYQKKSLYLKSRIAAAEKVISLMSESSNNSNIDFNDKNQCAILEQNIFQNAYDACFKNQTEKKDEKSEKKDIKSDKSNLLLQEFIKKSQNKSANDYMQDAFTSFVSVASEYETPEQKATLRDMAKDVFGISQRVEKGEITSDVLDGMVKHFVKSTDEDFIPNIGALTLTGRQKKEKGISLSSQDYKYPVDVIRTSVKKFAESYLEKYNEQRYNQEADELKIKYSQMASKEIESINSGMTR